MKASWRNQPSSSMAPAASRRHGENIMASKHGGDCLALSAAAASE